METITKPDLARAGAAIARHLGVVVICVALLLCGGIAGIGVWTLKSELITGDTDKPIPSMNGRLMWTNLGECFVVATVTNKLSKLTRITDCDRK